MDAKKLASFLDKKKKDGGEMTDLEKKAKVSVLSNLKDRASQAMGSKLKGLKGAIEDATSKSAPGHTLEVDISPEESEHDGELHAPGEENAEDEEEAKELDAIHGESGGDTDHLSEDELDAHIKKLIERRDSLKNRK